MAGRLRRTGERGSATLELAVLAPGMILLLALLAFAGRHAMASATVEHAAADAARAASLQRTAAAGHEAALVVANETLRGQGLSCLDTSVVVDTTGMTLAAGQRGEVTVTITCQLEVADLPLSLPTTVIRATAASPVDAYRER